MFANFVIQGTACWTINLVGWKNGYFLHFIAKSWKEFNLNKVWNTNVAFDDFQLWAKSTFQHFKSRKNAKIKSEVIQWEELIYSHMWSNLAQNGACNMFPSQIISIQDYKYNPLSILVTHSLVFAGVYFYTLFYPPKGMFHLQSFLRKICDTKPSALHALLSHSWEWGWKNYTLFPPPNLLCHTFSYLSISPFIFNYHYETGWSSNSL